MSRSRRTRYVALASVLPLLVLSVVLYRWNAPGLAGKAQNPDAIEDSQLWAGTPRVADASLWRDSLGDGFPDGARLATAQDRDNFIRWFTFLAEAQYYFASPRAQEEIRDCSGLVRYAFRNALMRHSAAWHHAVGLPYDPGFGDVQGLAYPSWPLGEALFRTRPGPFAPQDLATGAFAEFADSATLLRYNTYLISRDLRAARPGDLLFFRQSVQREPYHAMLFVGPSHFQPQGSTWIVYHTGDLIGRPGEVRALTADTLLGHPDPRWRPLGANPYFLGIYRLEILR